MKKLSIMTLIVLFAATSVFAGGVVKKTKYEIEFGKFGTFSNVQTEMISRLKKATDSDSEFKGKGLLGKLAGKFALRSGEETRIFNLSEMTETEIDHRKKTYTVQPIEKYSPEDVEEPDEYEEETEMGEEESDIKIIRNEFSVDKTGESRTINGFPSQKYAVTWILEWENIRTGEKGTNRLLTDIWTTPLTGDLQKGREIEQEFSREHMQRMGVDLQELQEEMLGTNWLSIFSRMDSQSQAPDPDASRFADEMGKIEGYPVVIDGKYFTETEGGPQEEEESGIGGLLGGLAKKAIKKDKKDDPDQPALSYYIELLEYQTTGIPETEFQPPAGYQEK